MSNNAQLLWFHLFCLWNEAGFPDWLQVDILRMMGMIQVTTRSTLIRARGELIEAGLIVSQRGFHKQPNKYRFVVFGDQNKRYSENHPKNEHQTSHQTSHETGHETSHETRHIYKLIQMKTKVKKEKAVQGEYGNVWLTREEL